MLLVIFLLILLQMCNINVRVECNSTVSANDTNEIITITPEVKSISIKERFKGMKRKNYNRELMESLQRRKLWKIFNFGVKYYNSTSAFKSFNNTVGVKYPIIPNIVHFLNINQSKFSFVDAMCLKAVFLNHVPDKIFIHTNVEQFIGYHWENLVSDNKINSSIQVTKAEIPSNISNSYISDINVIRDYVKLKILAAFGGIFLDNDVYVVKNLDRYMQFELVMPWKGPGYSISNKIIIAHKHSRFLKAWIQEFENNFKPSSAQYNSVEFPTKLAAQNASLLHTEPRKFVVEPRMLSSIYLHQWPAWKSKSAIWLMMSLRKARIKLPFDEYAELRTTDSNSTTFGEMVKAVF